ncbi:hypothetical protein N473_01695 [Pseudoalteromonas luteoviolacea CPMOR-1]|uniref:Uncharacterized protein n=1 Tax=Pseudoalteromonas luteoviolacea CPMOR-1 TaxID=1365248 RepID=A0A161YMU4_9GAMM|nr:hypothetical protein N473_01695 [Pseudoalteromonas luteoviolacea CPMOR-1]
MIKPKAIIVYLLNFIFSLLTLGVKCKMLIQFYDKHFALIETNKRVFVSVFYTTFI